MNDPLFGSIVVTGLTVSFLHSALPTHWLPFVLAGRRQGWRRNKTLTITALPARATSCSRSRWGLPLHGSALRWIAGPEAFFRLSWRAS